MFHYGAQGRHIISVTSSQGAPFFFSAWLDEEQVSQVPEFIAWFQEMPKVLRDDIQLALESGEEMMGEYPCEPRQLRVVASRDQVSWSRKDLALLPEDAARLLALPLSLLVEDGVNDANFIRHTLSPTWGEYLEGLLENGSVEFSHGGGVGSMSRLVSELGEAFTATPSQRQTRQQMRCLRLWVMSDSDAHGPWVGAEDFSPSPQVIGLSEKCAKHGVPHHILRRRMIENYASPASVADYCQLRARKMNRAERRKVYAKLDALSGLSETSRHFLNMKKEFGDKLDEHVFGVYAQRRGVCLFDELNDQGQQELEEIGRAILQEA